MNAWKHFKTITKHRRLVRRGCFRVGLYWRGLTHDLSKFSPTEFWAGARYYQGVRSPNAAEREENGYSRAWMHHKGRNRHHYEYWTDLNTKTGRYEAVEMPTEFLVEMVMDRIAASKVYRGAAYTDADPLRYFETAHESTLMHPNTQRKLKFLLSMLKDDGEEKTFRFLREIVQKDKKFVDFDT